MALPQKENAGIFSITEYTMEATPTKYELFSTGAQNVKETMNLCQV